MTLKLDNGQTAFAMGHDTKELLQNMQIDLEKKKDNALNALDAIKFILNEGKPTQ